MPERGAAVIYITHRLGEVATVAERAIVLRDGANAGTLARGELTHDHMISLMVGPAGLSPRAALAGLFSGEAPAGIVVRDIRLPRTLLAVLTGTGWVARSLGTGVRV